MLEMVISCVVAQIMFAALTCSVIGVPVHFIISYLIDDYYEKKEGIQNIGA